MRLRLLKFIGLCYLLLASTARADESLHLLKVKDQVYTNVTVTTVTPTDIYFTYAQGMASAKLKDLDPELQKHFHFDAAKSAQIEQADIQATANYRAKLAEENSASTANAEDAPEFVVPKIYARSIRGQSAPKLEIEKWLTSPPATDGKFILVDFFATWSGPCRKSIPQLNIFQKEYADRLVIIGVTDESEGVVRRMTSPKIEYAVAIDPAARAARKLQISGIPHCILIDPSGIVRFEGTSLVLNERILKHYLDKYSR